MADVTDELEGRSPAVTREGLLKRAGAAAFAVSMFGGLTDRALGFYGPLKYANKQLSGDLRILQWTHFVPAYDKWLDNTYLKQWGEANDVEVKIDHINLALIPSAASSEVAAQSGHDLVQFLSPPASFQKQVIPLNDIVQEVTRKLGPITKVGHQSTYSPKTKRYFGFADNYVPDPAHYRKSLWNAAGGSLKTWEDVRKAAPLLKEEGHPIGLGMSNELDSNMFLFALLYCYGGFVQNEEGRIVFNTGTNRKGAIEALELMRDIYRNGMSDEVFAWTPASNNQAFVAGRLSFAMNAISIARTLEASGNTAVAEDTWIASIPRGPVMRLGNEHVMGIYAIWRFAKNKEAAKRFLVDQQLAYRSHFLESQYYNFPAWTGAIKGGFKEIRRISAQDTHKPRGKYTILTTIAEKYTTNVGYPGFSNAVIDEIFNRYLIPQMFAEVAQGKSNPADAVRAFDREAKKIYRKWRNAGLV